MLPNLNESINYTELKLSSGKTIGYKGWRVKEEKEFLFASSRLDKYTPETQKLILNLLKNCVDDKMKFDTLSHNDIKQIAVATRRVSKGEDIEYSGKCHDEKCQTKFDDVILLDKDILTTEFDVSPIVINDSLVFILKEISFNSLLELQTRFKEEPEKLIFYHLVNSIEAINYQGTAYTEFNEEEMVNFIDQMEPNDLSKLQDEFYKKSSSVKIFKTVKCKKCKKDIEVEIYEVLDFLFF